MLGFVRGAFGVGVAAATFGEVGGEGVSERAGDGEGNDDADEGGEAKESDVRGGEVVGGWGE